MFGIATISFWSPSPSSWSASTPWKQNESSTRDLPDRRQGRWRRGLGESRVKAILVSRLTSRVAPQVFTTIETIVLLRQFERTPDKQDCLIATYEDYEWARRLLLTPLQASLGDKKARQAEAMKKQIGKTEFTTSECMKICGFRSRKTVKDRLDSLKEADLLEVVKHGLGKTPTVWGWTLTPILPETKTLRYRVTHGVKTPSNAGKA